MNFKHYNDNEIKNRLRKLQGEMPGEFTKLIDAYNRHEISYQDYEKIKQEYMQHVRDRRASLMAELDRQINQAEVAYLNELAGGSDIERFVSVYDKVSQIDSPQLAEEYEKALKIGDKTAMKACAFTAAEKGMKRIINDYSLRDPKWQEVAEEYRGFVQNIASKDAKIQNQLADPAFQLPEPKIKTKPMQFGYVKVNGANRPHFIDRLELAE